MGAYGEAGPWGVWMTIGAESRWFRHHRGGAMPWTEAEAHAVADTLNRSGSSSTAEARPLVWSDSKQEYVAR